MLGGFVEASPSRSLGRRGRAFWQTGTQQFNLSAARIMLRLTMRKSKLRAAAGVLPWIMALSLTGCQPARQQTAAAEDPAPAETAGAVDEAQGVAEASLGKQAEILARGDLA